MRSHAARRAHAGRSFARRGLGAGTTRPAWGTQQKLPSCSSRPRPLGAGQPLPAPEQGTVHQDFPRGLCVGGAGTGRCSRHLRAGELPPGLQARTRLTILHSQLARDAARRKSPCLTPWVRVGLEGKAGKRRPGRGAALELGEPQGSRGEAGAEIAPGAAGQRWPELAGLREACKTPAECSSPRHDAGGPACLPGLVSLSGLGRERAGPQARCAGSWGHGGAAGPFCPEPARFGSCRHRASCRGRDSI